MDSNGHRKPPELDPWPSAEGLHPYATGTVEQVDVYCLALLHFKDTIAPESSLLDDWPPSDGDQRWYCLGVLRELLPEEEADYRSLATLLANTPQVAREAGFDPNDVLHYSTLARNIRTLPVDNDVLEAAATRADRAAQYTVKYAHPLDALGPDPPDPAPEHLEWTTETPVEMSEKMQQATRRVAEYLALTMPPLGFNGDQLAPQLRVPHRVLLPATGPYRAGGLLRGQRRGGVGVAAGHQRQSPPAVDAPAVCP